jgi:hypothetical protein
MANAVVPSFIILSYKSIMPVSLINGRMTLSMTTLDIMTLRVMTHIMGILGMMGLNIDTQHNNIFIYTDSCYG